MRLALVFAAMFVMTLGTASAQSPLTFDPPIETGLEATIESGDSIVLPLTVTNATSDPLDFSFVGFGASERAPAAPLANTPAPPITVKGSTGASPVWLPGRGVGGPDAFGYVWTDSEEPNGPEFEPIDIRDTGTHVQIQPVPDCTFDVFDEGAALVELPFAFPFYGESYDEVVVSVNGHLNFIPYSGCSFPGAGQPLPNTSPPNATIAPFWSDLEVGGNGTIKTETLDDGRFVVQYTDVSRWGHLSQLTFQVILTPNGTITYQYLTIEGNLSSALQIGIEDADGSIGLLVASGLGYAQPGLAVRIAATAPFVTDVNPAQGTLDAGASVQVDVTLSAVGLDAGEYTSALTVLTPEGALSYPVALSVTGEGALEANVSSIEFGQEVVGAEALSSVVVQNVGADTATVTDASTDDDAFTVLWDEESVVLEPGSSTTLWVRFSPLAAGEATGTLTISGDVGDPIAVALAGSGIAPPQAVLSDTTLTFVFNPDAGWTGEATLSLGNIAPSDAADLTFSSFARPVDSETLMGRSAANEVVLTQNLSLEINSGYASACGTAPYVPTSYWRVFDLADTDLSEGLTITGVDLGLAQGADTETQLRLYRLQGTLQNGELTLLAEETVPLNADDPIGLVPVAVSAIIGPDEQIAIEWNVPFDLGANAFIGSNDAGATHPFYISYPGCFSVDYPPSPTTANPWVLTVRGLAGPPPFSVAPGEGVVAPGEAETLTVTVDATEMPEGLHHYEVVILTNDPDNPIFVVPVAMDVAAQPVSAEDETIPAQLTLHPAFPNPTTGVTRIAFDLPEAAPVRLDVYDALGRRVATLVDAPMSAGQHSVTWNARDLAAGLYLYRLQSGQHVQTLRATVAR